MEVCYFSEWVLTNHIGSHADEVPPGYPYQDFIIDKVFIYIFIIANMTVIEFSTSMACMILSKGVINVNVHFGAPCEQEKLSADVYDSKAHK